MKEKKEKKNGGYETAEVRGVRRIGGGRGLCGGPGEWMGCFLDDLRAFGINADHWTTAAQNEGEWRRTAKQGAERFMAKWIAAEKVRADAVVCPNVTGRTKERIAQSKLVLVRSPLLTSHRWCELTSSRRMWCCLLWCYVCFVLFRYHCLRPFFVSVSSIYFCFFGDVPFLRVLLHHYRLFFV